ncbi:hypothetical protein DM860_013191 [Cuscuta australis]|uniref:Uncharacterized protein n=1 Tax=Cuscuta australis TaxID=267555 RepID=A0A328DP30_9ASTE|nr:hypothetical protein DM860_013191 [Cuscuta australis]
MSDEDAGLLRERHDQLRRRQSSQAAESPAELQRQLVRIERQRGLPGASEGGVHARHGEPDGAGEADADLREAAATVRRRAEGAEEQQRGGDGEDRRGERSRGGRRLGQVSEEQKLRRPQQAECRSWILIFNFHPGIEN